MIRRKPKQMQMKLAYEPLRVLLYLSDLRPSYLLYTNNFLISCYWSRGRCSRQQDFTFSFVVPLTEKIVAPMISSKFLTSCKRGNV